MSGGVVVLAVKNVGVAEAVGVETEVLTGVVVVDLQAAVVTVMDVMDHQVEGEDVLETGGVLYPAVATTTLPGVTAATVAMNLSRPALMMTMVAEVVSEAVSVAEETVEASGDVVGIVVAEVA